MRVLAMDLDQQSGEFGQLRKRHRTAVDPCPRSAVGTQHAAEQAGVAIVQLLFAQPSPRGGGIANDEFGLEFGALAAVAHHRGIGAFAREEAQGIDQQGFAGAGFAGNDGHSTPEFEFGGGDDGEVADGQTLQHGVDSRGCRRIRRDRTVASAACCP